MKKGYYIYVENCGSVGVIKKIKMQIKAFARQFEIKEVMIEKSNRNLGQRIAGLFLWNSVARKYEAALKKIENPDFVYIRRTYADKQYLEFIKSIKKLYPRCKIIIEMPVFPYKKEMLSYWYTAFMYIKEIMYRNRYKECIDRFVTYSDDTEIYGVPTICTMNGIDVDSVCVVKAKDDYEPNKINLIAVALLARHHGYERILKGLKEYYKTEQKRKVYFHIVGDGTEGKKYKRLVKRYHLETYVKFYGPKFGKELDNIYDIADAGVDAFGVYKDGLSKLCTIKAREYLAKGIPVISGAQDSLFVNGKSIYGLNFPNNHSLIEIEKIITYLDDLYLGKKKNVVNKEIRDYAYKYIDNEITLMPIVAYINEKEEEKTDDTKNI